MKIHHWDYLKSVTALAKTGTYRAASDALGITNTTVSRQIQQLERELGVPIFVMKDGIWVLTDSGVKLAKLSSEFHAQLSFFSTELEGQAKFNAHIKISTVSFIENFFLSESTKLWADENPNATLTIKATDQTDAVELGHCDLGLRLARPEQLGLKRLKLSNSPVSLFAPTHHHERNWIGLSDKLDTLPEMQMAQAKYGKEPTIRLDSYPAIAKASLSTGFPGILPTCIASYFQGLRRLETFNKSYQINRELWVVFHEKRHEDCGIRASIAWLQKIFPSPAMCLCGACDLQAGL